MRHDVGARTVVAPTPRSRAAAVVLTVLLATSLAGCGTSSDQGPEAATSSDPTSSPTADTTSPAAPDGAATDRQGGSGDGTGSGDNADDATSPSGAGSDDGTTSGPDDAGTSDESSELEMPEAPEPTVDSLAELIEEQRSGPLVALPLPRAASAVGRLAPGFPSVLRPTRSSTVGSSSISPSGQRLQVALVATTRMGPEQVLLTLRTRLTLRGLTEQPAPVAAPDSSALAFRRGRSVVTLTVTAAGAGTSYSIDGSLHAGGE